MAQEEHSSGQIYVRCAAWKSRVDIVQPRRIVIVFRIHSLDVGTACAIETETSHTVALRQLFELQNSSWTI
jgi:hypothetical protein